MEVPERLLHDIYDYFRTTMTVYGMGDEFPWAEANRIKDELGEVLYPHDPSQAQIEGAAPEGAPSPPGGQAPA